MSANITQSGARTSESPSEKTTVRRIGIGRNTSAGRNECPTTSMMIASGTSEMTRFTAPASTVAMTKMLFGT